MQSKLRILIFLFIISYFTIFLFDLFTKEIVANVQPFTRFEIEDPPADWTFKLQDRLNSGFEAISPHPGFYFFSAGDQVKKSECKIGYWIPNYPSPDISSVSYSSNGTNLNTTLWLSSPFRDNESYINHIIMDKNTSIPLQVLYNVYVINTPNYQSLSEAVKDYVNKVKDNITDFHLYAKNFINFKDDQAYKLVYTYRTNPDDIQCKNCKYGSIDVLILKNNKLYIFSYKGDLKVLNENVAAVIDIFNSTKIFKENDDSMFAEPDYDRYENSNYRISIIPPDSAEWDHFNTFKKTDPNSIQTYYPPVNSSIIAIATDDISNQELTLDQLLERRIEYYKNAPNFRFIEKNANSSPKGENEYNFTFQYSGKNVEYQHMEFGRIVDNDLVFRIIYIAPTTEFDSYFEEIKTMINSFNTNIDTLTFFNSIDLIIYYPYNWAVYPYFPITGFSNKFPLPGYNNSDYDSAVTFVSPVKGPYLLSRGYQMALDYDSPYLQKEHSLPYSITIFKDSSNDLWLKEIVEWSADGKNSKILSNVTLQQELFRQGQTYVPLDLNLNYLNLPNQFYLSHYTREYYIKDGKTCHLEDRTDFLSVPPPTYLLRINPTSLKNISIGDEKIVQVQLQSNNNLPFKVSFYSESKDLKLTFNPTQTAGVSNGITTSDLRIKVLPNATVKSYTIPISAELILTPTFNVNNSTSATMIKTTNFTITTSAALSWYEQVKLELSSWSNALTVPTAIISIISGILGLGIGKIWKRVRKKNTYYY